MHWQCAWEQRSYNWVLASRDLGIKRSRFSGQKLRSCDDSNTEMWPHDKRSRIQKSRSFVVEIPWRRATKPEERSLDADRSHQTISFQEIYVSKFGPVKIRGSLSAVILRCDHPPLSLRTQLCPLEAYTISIVCSFHILTNYLIFVRSGWLKYFIFIPKNASNFDVFR